MNTTIYDVTYIINIGDSYVEIILNRAVNFEDINIKDKLIDDLRNLGFMGYGEYRYNALMSVLNIDDVKLMLKKFHNSALIMELTIALNYRDIVQLYPGTLDTLQTTYSMLELSMDESPKDVLFYIETHAYNIADLLDRFDLNGYGFESYHIDDKFRIAVKNETDLKKMKLIGLVDFIKSHDINSPYCVIVTDSLMDRLPWKL